MTLEVWNRVQSTRQAQMVWLWGLPCNPSISDLHISQS